MSSCVGERQIVVGMSNIMFDKIPQVYQEIRPYKPITEVIEHLKDGVDESFSNLQDMVEKFSELGFIKSVEIKFNQINTAIESGLLNQIIKKNKIPPEQGKKINQSLKNWIKEELKKIDVKLSDEARDAVLNMVISAMIKTDKIILKERGV